MTRSLEGKRFYLCGRNGVNAVIDENTLRSRERKVQIELALAASSTLDKAQVVHDALRHLGMPTFTFTETYRYKRCPVFTGDFGHLGSLLSYVDVEGGTFQEQSFYVPFSNGYEIGLQGLERQRIELGYVTTQQQFFATFGEKAPLR